MASNREHFSVGEIQCIAINDGTFSYPPDWFFSNVPQEQLQESLRNRDLPLNQVISPYTCLVVKTGKHRVLIDTGADGLAPTTGDLLKHLKAEGITVFSNRRMSLKGSLDGGGGKLLSGLDSEKV